MLPELTRRPLEEDTFSGRVTECFRRAIDRASEPPTIRLGLSERGMETAAPTTLPKASPVLLAPAPAPLTSLWPPVPPPGALSGPRPAPPRRWPLFVLVGVAFVGALLVSRPRTAAECPSREAPRVLAAGRVERAANPALSRAPAPPVETPVRPPRRANAKHRHVKPAAKPVVDDLAEAQLRAAAR